METETETEVVVELVQSSHAWWVEVVAAETGTVVVVVVALVVALVVVVVAAAVVVDEVQSNQAASVVAELTAEPTRRARIEVVFILIGFGVERVTTVGFYLESD